MSIQSAIDALQSVLGEGLSVLKSDLEGHGGSETYFPLTPPDAVAYPTSTDDVVKIVTTCALHDCPVIGWGAGTSLEGNGLAVRGGICVDFSRMNNVLEINSEDMDVRVQPGITREDLNRELRTTGLFFPVDPGANATLGGMAATSASGTTTVRYGTMRDNVRALEVVLADGRVIRTGSRARKSSAGYDLTALFVGSEGTLGLITELTLRLYGQPEKTAAAIAGFPTISAAVESVIASIQLAIPMARIEFLDAETVRGCNAYASRSMPEIPHLLMEFHGTELGVKEDARRLGEIISDAGGSDFEWATKTEDRKALWAMRHEAYYACLGLRKGARALVTDVCVPISQLAQAVEETQADISDHNMMGPILGHVGDGNFHAIILVDPDNEAELATAKKLGHRMAERALDLGGTVTGEHGIGLGKIGLLEQEHGEATRVMAGLKTALDPKNLMNPGKIFQTN